MALVDDCIKDRWQTKKIHHLPILGNVEYVGPRAFMQRVFSQRRTSSDGPQEKGHFKAHEDPQDDHFRSDNRFGHSKPIPAF